MEVLHTYKLYQYNYEVYGSLKLLDSFGVEWDLIYQKSDQSVQSSVQKRGFYQYD